MTDTVDGNPNVDLGKVSPEEIRFAVVLNGGVSLAVWMGGVTMEIDRIAKAGSVSDTRGDNAAYAAMLKLTRSSARVDVLTGTSAGGINGAALALAQANGKADMHTLRDVWAEQGRMRALLRQPFRGAPLSLLRGDEYYLPNLADALNRMAKPFEARPPQPIDLTITTTLLTGAPLLVVDGLGQQLPQNVHEAQFRFLHDPDGDIREFGDPTPTDSFAAANIESTAARLALAARCSSSFPVAFEPSFVPVAKSDSGSAEVLRPDMSTCASWARPAAGLSWSRIDSDETDMSRFVVDGGLLVNTPTKAALAAVDRLRADRPTRRVMLLVYPHASTDVTSKPDDADKVLSIAEVGGKLLGALSSQGSRTFVEEVERHNRTARGRADGRMSIIRSLQPTPQDSPRPVALRSLARSLDAHHRNVRIERAAQTLAARIPAHPHWSFDRVLEACKRAHIEWGADLPYVPERAATGSPRTDSEHWLWGDETARGIADAALDFARHLAENVAPSNVLTAVRTAIHEHRATLRLLREALDTPWLAEPTLIELEPDQDYWRLRLAAYAYHVRGQSERLDDLPAEFAAAIRLIKALTPPTRGSTAQARSPEPGAFGIAMKDAVTGIASELCSALDIASRDPAVHAVAEWRQLFDTSGVPADRRATQVLERLTDLEIVSFCLLDSSTQGESLIRLVQFSLSTTNAFAQQSVTPREKSASMALNRFAGFLKQSWRINDWIWGRVDAATMLCRTVLDPARLSQTLAVRTATAAQQLDEFVGTAFHGGFPGDDEPELTQAYTAALDELKAILREDNTTTAPPLAADNLAKLAAWALHIDIILEELPALASSVRADRHDGANSRSRGELFLDENAHLLNRIAALPKAPPSDERDRVAHQKLRIALGVAALRAFDRAGIGREALSEEMSSDQMIATATAAAAVAVTAVDSPTLGLPAVRPVTRGLRGVMLLPYWVISGLTSAGLAARGLSVLGLSVGGVLLVMSLLDLLPSWAAALGAGTLLAALAYSALRTGTMLHGLVLLTPVVPLVVYSIQAPSRISTSADDIPGWTIIALIAVVAALVVLGSLPSPVRGPVATLRYLLRGWRRIAKSLMAFGSVIGLGVVALFFFAHIPRWRDELRAWIGHPSFPIGVWGVTAVVFVVVLLLLVSLLSVHAVSKPGLRQAGTRPGRLVRTPRALDETQSVTSQWAMVYGVGYVAVTIVLWFAHVYDDTNGDWGLAAICTSAVLGLVLLLVVPTWRAVGVWLDLRKHALVVDLPATLAADPKPLIRHLTVRGSTYCLVVRCNRTGDDYDLTWLGRRLATRLDSRHSVTPRIAQR
ncbi:patatin-like protein [Nocardia nepalensis]|uniref:patatin-like protein n=1 Tax=Nocardia nepalensis TaxID=3375448 RepID=UPI003B674656